MSPILSEEARKQKNEYNSEYGKKTNYASQKKYYEKNKEQLKHKAFILSLPKDQDILNHLNKIPNISGYVKMLIRKDMNKDESPIN